MVSTCISSVASETVGDVLSDEVRMLDRIGHRLLGDPHDHAFVGALTRDGADGARRAEVEAVPPVMTRVRVFSIDGTGPSS
jgi:hypothetical protein